MTLPERPTEVTSSRNHLPDRNQAWNLLCEWTQSDSLRKHALAVEAAMRYLAERRGGDPELWGLAGLLHDLDYERYPTPNDHPYRGAEELRRLGYPEELVHAVLAHAEHTGTARETDLDRALFAVDELTGLITAVALVRPDRSLQNLEPASVLKKMKDKRFAAGVDRETIKKGAAELGIELPEFISQVIAGMRAVATELGLA
ncbi:MAG TPA: HDIG domain-containing protein [Firmicutes bacterium]|nr:HDIG domain-containing protein [Bacillota bacterium]